MGKGNHNQTHLITQMFLYFIPIFTLIACCLEQKEIICVPFLIFYFVSFRFFDNNNFLQLFAFGIISQVSIILSEC